jgi:hypothetical protein
MGETMGDAYKILLGKHEGMRYEINLTQDGGQYRDHVNTVMNLRLQQKA